MSLYSKPVLAVHGVNEKNVVSTKKGGNSIIYKCQKTDGSFIGVKEYLGETNRRIVSMEREVESLNFFHKNNFKNTSKLISFDKSYPSICYDWIDGATPEVNDYSKNQITEALVSLNLLYEIDPSFPLAVDALSSSTLLAKQIATRMVAVNAYLSKYPEILQSIREALGSRKVKSVSENTFPINTYSFSDIGTHNMLIDSEAKIYFVDFEFFGADSKVKMFADLYAHPKSIFTREEIASLAIKLLLTDYEVHQLSTLMPDIAIKWALITTRRLANEIAIGQDSANQILQQVKDYLKYSKYLEEISAIDLVLTFSEFKRMQQ